MNSQRLNPSEDTTNKTTYWRGPLMLAVALAASHGPRVAAKEWHVATAQELASALFIAQDNGENDAVFFAAGIYRGTFTFRADEAQSLTLRPEPGLKPGDVVLDGENRGQVLRLNAPNGNLTLQDLVVKRGSSPQSGGGIYVQTTKSVLIANSLITDNSSSASGGGIFSTGAASCVLSNNSLVNNSASYGGGVSMQSCTAVLIANSHIGSNRAGGAGSSGGGVDLSQCGTVSIRDNTISGNAAATGGGGIYASGSSVSIDRNVIAGNSGGGVSASASDTLTMTGNTVRGNDKSYALDLSPKFGYLQRNSVVQNNTHGIRLTLLFSGIGIATDNIIVGNAGLGFTGGGDHTTLEFINNTVYDNSQVGTTFNSGTQGEVWVYNNIIWGNGGGDFSVIGDSTSKKFINNNSHSAAGTWNVWLNNIDVNPLFVDVPNGNYHLRANSLCLNAGANGAPGLSLVDRDGNLRIGDGIVDIGAYEQSTTDQHPADTDNNWILSEAEFNPYANAWINRLPWATGPNPIPIDYATRAGFLRQSGGAYTNLGGGKPINWKP